MLPRLRDIEARAHDHRSPRLEVVIDSGNQLLNLVVIGQVAQLEVVAECVIERQHAMGLAATEVRLQLHHRVAAHAPRPLQIAQAFGHIG